MKYIAILTLAFAPQSIMKVVAQKVVAVATILSLVAVSYFISVSEDASSSYRNLSQEVSPARTRREGEIKRLSSLRNKKQMKDAEVLQRLENPLWLKKYRYLLLPFRKRANIYIFSATTDFLISWLVLHMPSNLLTKQIAS